LRDELSLRAWTREKPVNVLTRSGLHRHLNRPGIVTAALFAISLSHAGLVSAAPIVSLSPTPATAAVGDLISLDLTLTDFDDLFAYQFDIIFDPAILQISGVTDGEFLTSGGGISVFGGVFALALDNSAGVITILDSLLGPAPPAFGVSGAGVLATLVFSAVLPGTTDILFSSSILENSSGLAIDATFTSGQVTVTDAGGGVTPVPEPGTLSLVLLGMAYGLKRVRRAKSRDGSTASPSALPVSER
jgi:hypothetical protein